MDGGCGGGYVTKPKDRTTRSRAKTVTDVLYLWPGRQTGPNRRRLVGGKHIYV